MWFGLDGVEIGLLIVFLFLFGGILSGFPVAFAIGGSAVISFGVIAGLDSAGLLIHQALDTSSAEFAAVVAEGIRADAISVFTHPDLPRLEEPVFPQGWEQALDRNVSFIVNRMNERVLAGQSIETLLAVLMFVLMGITLERSKIANDLLLTMARVFGPLPGGLAVSIVVVGAFLAASTGIVGATVVTMGLLALPTMLRNNYSPELATGVIAASGTLGQIIPPSIVIVLLGTLAGDLYSAAQEDRARLVGCSDALTYLGEPAVVSVGTLFQAALIPGIMLALLYAAYAFGYALFNPSKAPAVEMGSTNSEVITKNEALTWFLFVPIGLVLGFFLLSGANVIGNQTVTVGSFSEAGQTASLRTNVSPDCQAAMIELHGQDAWDAAMAEQASIDAAGGVTQAQELTEDERALALDEKLAAAAPIGTGIAVGFLLLALTLTTAMGISPSSDPRPLWIGLGAAAFALFVDAAFITPLTSPGATFLRLLVPLAIVLWACSHAVERLGRNELLRVVFPPLVLIVAVLGSILGGITNPTPAAALGAGGAIMLAAYRKLKDDNKSGKLIIMTSFSLVIMLLVGVNFDLRVNQASGVGAETWFAFIVAQAAYLFTMFGLLYGCYVLWAGGVLKPVVRETAKVTSMVFTIVFLVVMLVLFLLGFVLDFLEIIYIVIPIVGPVIYGGSFDPKWVTIMIAVNLQTSFLTPPFGFALFYLRGVAPPEVTTQHIYRGIVPFVLIQVVGLAILWFFPDIVTILPDLIPN